MEMRGLSRLDAVRGEREERTETYSKVHRGSTPRALTFTVKILTVCGDTITKCYDCLH